MLAMYNAMQQKNVVPKRASLSEQIFAEYLVDKYQDEDTRIKLKPVKNDREAFGKLFNDSTEYIKDSNLTVNYYYFYERIQKQKITVDELFEAICRL